MKLKIYTMFMALVSAVLMACQTTETEPAAVVARTQSVLFANAGGPWGTWGNSQYCPAGEFAYGLRTRIEASQGGGDDTALNTIQLLCRPETSSATPETTIIKSKEGFWGDWSSWAKCSPQQLLVSYELKVEGNQGSGDDTAANSIKMGCRSISSSSGTPTSVLEPKPTSASGAWGTYVGYREAPVGTAICGIQTKVEDKQGSKDDTALNDVKFFHCTLTTPITYNLNLSVYGPGTIKIKDSTEINCTSTGGPICSANIATGRQITLEAVQPSTSVLGWGETCITVTPTTCTFIMSSNRTFTINFQE
jgi:hypothetical protein